MARPESSLRNSPMELTGPKRTLFTRGKRGKRLSSGFTPGPEIDSVEEVDGGNKRISVLRKGRKGNRQSDATGKSLYTPTI